MRSGPVLIATDLGESSPQVVSAGLTLAEQLSAPPVLLHVDANSHLFSESFGAVPANEIARMQRQYSGQALDRALTLVRELGKTPADVDVAIGQGRVHEAILAEAERRAAQAIVVGSHVRKPLERLLVGRTAQRVIRGADCGVFTVDVRHPWSGVQRILFASDLGPRGSRAEHWAARLAGSLGAHLTVAHVVDVGSNLAAPYVIPPSAHEAIRASFAERLEGLKLHLADLAARHAPGPLGIAAKLLTAPDVAAAILDAAERAEADLIVLGTHGRHGLARAFLGSVAEGVVNRASTCVLTVKNGS